MNSAAVTIIAAIIGSGILNTVINQLITAKTRASGETQALRLIMKDRLRFLCTRYIEQNWIYEDELEDLIAMHSCYHDGLHGNGYLDGLMERVKCLEIRGIGVK